MSAIFHFRLKVFFFLFLYVGVSLPFRVRQRKRLQIWGPNWPNCKAQKGIEGKLREEGLVDGGGWGVKED